MPKASVLIVDDHLLIRYGLKQMLSQECRGLVSGEAKNSDEAFVRLVRQPWDLVILGIAVPGNGGFSVLQEIRRLHPSTRVLVLNMHADGKSALRAQQLGAAGYVPKNADRAALLRAFKSVLAGKKYFEDLPSPTTVAGSVPGVARFGHAGGGGMPADGSRPVAFPNGYRVHAGRGRPHGPGGARFAARGRSEPPAPLAMAGSGRYPAMPFRIPAHSRSGLAVCRSHGHPGDLEGYPCADLVRHVRRGRSLSQIGRAHV